MDDGSPHPFQAAGVVGDYRLEARVARGGMGEIWRATHLPSGRAAAVKRLRFSDEHSPRQSYRARLIREARILQRLEHPNIVEYLGAGFDEQGLPYLAMEWLDGESLSGRQRRRPLELHQVLEATRQALQGLGQCHLSGVVHRDVKPGNLFLVETGGAIQLKVVDFGLAFSGGDDTRLTKAGQIMGTLQYLSPEQVRGAQTVDARADLYALGVVLYELLTGRLPFDGDQPVTILLKIVTETPPAPRQLRPELPAWLERVVLHAMRRAPSERFADAEAMFAALGREVAAVAAADDPTASLPVTSAFAETLAPSTSIENRLVSLLCVRPGPGGDRARMVRRVTAAVEEAGGIVQRLLGGDLVGLFGLDQTCGDEALRAARAGLAIRRAIGAEARLLLATVHCEVGVGLQLDTSDLDRTIKLLAALPPGQLVLDPVARQLGGARLVTAVTAGGHHVVTGLESDRSARRRVLDVETPTVGRETELAAVEAAVERARGRCQPEAALLWGQPGIGKSRLHDELLPGLRAGCALCLEARGDPSKTRTSYGLLADALGRHAGLHVGQPLPARRRALEQLTCRLLQGDDDRAREVAAFVGEVIGIPAQGAGPALRVARADPQVMRERVVAAFEALLQGAGRAGLVALCLEDLHWADEESLELCEQLLERLERTPLFLLGTARPELLERRPGIFEAVEATRIELRPLGRRSLRRLLRALLGPTLSPGLERLIGRWSDGNPYFAEELVSWMVTRKLLARGPDGGWTLQTDPSALELPVGIEGAIQGRLDRLLPELKELLKAASVFGEVFWAGGCLALGFVETGRQLPELERAQFIAPRTSSRVAGTEEWIFRHALVQQVAYQMLPRDLRRHLHLLAARWLEGMGETDAALLALHFERGGDHDRSAEYYARAGEKALADGDLERAADCFHTSLGSGEPSERITERLGPALSSSQRLAPRQLSRRLLGLARTLILAGGYDRAWEALEQLPEPGTDQERAELLFMRGRILYGRTSYAEAEETLGQAAALLERGDGDPDLLFKVRHSLFYAVFAQGRYRRAVELGEALHAAALQDAQPDSLCTAKLALAYYNVADGDLSASITLAGEAVEHAREIGHPYREVDALTLLGFARELVGFYDEALAALSEAKQLAERMKTSYHLASISSSTGRVFLCRGDSIAALASYRDALERADELGNKRIMAMALAGQARALLLEDKRNVQGAEEAAARAVEIAKGSARTIEPEARMALSAVYLAAGRGAAAAEQALAAVEVVNQLEIHEQREVEILITAHKALSSCGRSEEARRMLELGRRIMDARSARIDDDVIRESFLHQVSYNSELLCLTSSPSA